MQIPSIRVVFLFDRHCSSLRQCIAMSQLTVDGVAALTVASLKVELTARGLDTKGLKAALVERLTAYLVEHTTVLCRHCHAWRSSLTPRPRLSLTPSLGCSFTAASSSSIYSSTR
jgi:hypothetical protein